MWRVENEGLLEVYSRHTVSLLGFTSWVGRVYLPGRALLPRLYFCGWARLLPRSGAFTSKLGRVYLASDAGLPPWLSTFTSWLGAFTFLCWVVYLPGWACVLPKSGTFTSQVGCVYLASRAHLPPGLARSPPSSGLFTCLAGRVYLIGRKRLPPWSDAFDSSVGRICLLVLMAKTEVSVKKTIYSH